MANHPNRAQAREELTKVIQEVVTLSNAEQQKVEIVNLPATVDADFSDDAPPRLEEQKIPFLRMAQGLSPELNPGKAQYIPGLTLGMVFDTVMRRHYPGRPGLSVAVCWKDYHYGCWQPRDLGGGFRGALSPDADLVRATLARMAKKYGSSSARFHMPRFRDGAWTDDPPKLHETGEAIELIETGQLYVLYGNDGGRVDDTNVNAAIIPFTSTALDPYTSYVTRHDQNRYLDPRDGVRKPLQSYAYRWWLSTVPDKNAKGEFFNWKMELDIPGDFNASMVKKTTDPLYPLAVQFHNQCATGIVRPDYESAQDDGEARGDHGPTVDPDRAPF